MIEIELEYDILMNKIENANMNAATDALGFEIVIQGEPRTSNPNQTVDVLLIDYRRGSPVVYRAEMMRREHATRAATGNLSLDMQNACWEAKQQAIEDINMEREKALRDLKQNEFERKYAALAHCASNIFILKGKITYVCSEA